MLAATSAFADSTIWGPLDGQWRETTAPRSEVVIAGGAGQATLNVVLPSGTAQCVYALPEITDGQAQLVPVPQGNLECLETRGTLQMRAVGKLLILRTDGVRMASFGAVSLPRIDYPVTAADIDVPARDLPVIGLTLGMTRSEAEAILVGTRDLTVAEDRLRKGLRFVQYGDGVGSGEHVVIGYTAYSDMDAGEDRIAMIYRAVRPEQGSLFLGQLRDALTRRYGQDVVGSGDLSRLSNNRVSHRWQALEACQFPPGMEFGLTQEVRFTPKGRSQARRTLRVGCGPVMEISASVGGDQGVFGFEVFVSQGMALQNSAWAEKGATLRRTAAAAAQAMEAAEAAQSGGGADVDL
ncbi:MAG: hypothetical protein AAFY38_00280 [Pseudomonadota bacterium]